MSFNPYWQKGDRRSPLQNQNRFFIITRFSAIKIYYKLMDKKLVFRLFCYAAILGNIIFVLWILYNAIDEGFQGTPYEIATGIGLILLLTMESVLLYLAEIRF